MARVTLTINGRKFALGCDDGEEDRLAALGEKLDKRVQHLADQFGQIGDTRLLLMAGITLMDELEDSSGDATEKAELLAADIRRASEDAINIATKKEATAADNLVKAAVRIEQLAESLRKAQGNE